MDFVGHYIQDPEGLLHSLIPFCVGKEKDIIVLLLNLMQAKNIWKLQKKIMMHLKAD